ncbi:MAG: HD domain-containing protein [Bacteroidia bacterium]|nr:HD domain-containing protein [Bacteroidia bacterium]
MRKFSQALVFASRAHAGQHRKDGRTPYINHPIEVMNLVTEYCSDPDEEVLIAALLHDVVEDTMITDAEIRAAFGARVARLVAELTDDKTLSKEERKRLQLSEVHLLSNDGKLLRLCDKICNVYDIIYAPPGDWDTPRRLDYLQWAKAVVDKIRGTHEELERKFDDLYTTGIKILG